MKNKILKLFSFISILVVLSFITALCLKSIMPTEDKDEKTDVPAAVSETDNKADEKSVDENYIEARANEILSEMTLREKLYQMFIVTPDSLSGMTNTTSASLSLQKGMNTYPVGGIIFFSGNIENEAQLKNMIKTLSLWSEIPLFISTDQEGGMVARLNSNVNFPIFENMYEYKDMGEGKAYENAKIIAENMSALGFNLDFAPVADVWTNRENTVIGKRAYGDDYNQVATLIENAVKGFNDGGIICTLKHFPGHGNTYADTHTQTACVEKTKEQLKNEELLPFISGINAGADMVMVGHLMVTDIDNINPATISKAVVSDFLKDELGYEGIVITDALNMGAVSTIYTSYDLCPMAVKAGVDILLMPSELRSGAAGIENAVLLGEISEERIDESVRKILMLKIKHGIIN